VDGLACWLGSKVESRVNDGVAESRWINVVSQSIARNEEYEVFGSLGRNVALPAALAGQMGGDRDFCMQFVL